MRQKMITVLMATYNGAETLPEVLDAYCKLESPSGGYRLLVVDNGSTDQTKDIVDSFKSRLPLSSLFESRLGRTVALNTGLSQVSGDLIVVTDADAMPKPDWLVQIRIAADSHPCFDIFGGAIVAHWEIPPEDWILRWQCPTLAITDPMWNEGEIAASCVYGANLAIRSKILDSGYRFDTSLGPVGPCYGMGDETDFLQRVAAGGAKAWHCKRAVVAHMIRKDQMTKRWVLRRAIPSGRAEYRREMREEPSSPTLLLGFPRYMVREVLEQLIVVAGSALTQDAEAAFRERWRLRFMIGRAIEGRSLHCPSKTGA